MKALLLLSLLVFAVACSDPTGPQDEGIVVPDDGTVVYLSDELQASHPNMAFMVNGERGKWAMSCTTVSSSRRCALLWVGATATTTVAIASCVLGQAWSCAGAIISSIYSWDRFYQEPDCRTCADPFSYRTSGQWWRDDYLDGRGTGDPS